MQKWFRFLRDVPDLIDEAATDTPYMDTPVTPSADTGGEVGLPSLYSVEE